MKKNPKFYLALVIFCLTGQVAWTVENMYFNVFIYKMFKASADQISLMVAASAVAAKAAGDEQKSIITAKKSANMRLLYLFIKHSPY